MSFLHAVLLGLIQGVAEFLPISSSGHLAIAEQLLGVEGASEFPGFFDVLLHLAPWRRCLSPIGRRLGT